MSRNEGDASHPFFKPPTMKESWLNLALVVTTFFLTVIHTDIGATFVFLFFGYWGYKMYKR